MWNYVYLLLFDFQVMPLWDAALGMREQGRLRMATGDDRLSKEISLGSDGDTVRMKSEKI